MLPQIGFGDKIWKHLLVYTKESGEYLGLKKKFMVLYPLLFFCIMVCGCVFWKWLYILESGFTLYDFGVMKIYGFGVGNFQRENGGL